MRILLSCKHTEIRTASILITSIFCSTTFGNMECIYDEHYPIHTFWVQLPRLGVKMNNLLHFAKAFCTIFFSTIELNCIIHRIYDIDDNNCHIFQHISNCQLRNCVIFLLLLLDKTFAILKSRRQKKKKLSWRSIYCFIVHHHRDSRIG